MWQKLSCFYFITEWIVPVCLCLPWKYIYFRIIQWCEVKKECFSLFPHLPADLDVVSSGRRRTCALLNSPSPYVSNAICHMQELKTAVENWCQQVNWWQMSADPNILKRERETHREWKNTLKKKRFFPLLFWSSVDNIERSLTRKSSHTRNF